MAVIDQGGLFKGKRLRKCSAEARWRFPYLFLLSNGYARISAARHGGHGAAVVVCGAHSNHVAAGADQRGVRHRRLTPVEAGKSIQSQKGTERCLAKPDGKAATSS
ncbi:MAG TPA: hypothetical protein VII23_17915 [Terriglobales bacterium]|jgi:hypothetical protein